jgi:hypothetical protein
MVVNLHGTLKEKRKPKVITDNLEIAEFVLNIDEDTDYPQPLLINAINDKIQILNKYAVGEKLMVRCHLRGREKEGRYYNSVTMFDMMNKNRELAND